MLVDQFGRRVKKLRVSLTDRCNLRCHYCMPVDQKFMDDKKYLTPLEITTIVEELQSLGLEEVRLTGGEPLLRKSFSEIISKLSLLRLKKLSLTTNGINLDKYLGVLKDHGVMHLNISLDSLNEENFKKITFGNHLSRILDNIKSALDSGFNLKINMVVMKGINDHEIFDFINFSQRHDIEVRFLELMRIGYACAEQGQQFLSADEMLKMISKKMDLKKVSVPEDSTSFNFLTADGAKIGFIASESKPFCGSCSRWRLSADGILRACLLKEDGYDIKVQDRFEIYQKLLGMKPYLRPKEVAHTMNLIGG